MKKVTSDKRVRHVLSNKWLRLVCLFGLIGVFLGVYSYLDQRLDRYSKNIAIIPTTSETKRCYINKESWVTVAKTADCDVAIKPYTKPSPTSTDQPIVQQAKNVANSDNWEDTWKVEKVDDLTTDSRMPPDDRMATSDELFEAINNYRNTHGLGSVQKHQTLCGIAQARADQQFAGDSLDSHQGFTAFAESQQDFSKMGEILQGGIQPNYAVHIVEWGWGRSLTGHRESMLDSKWTHGCGGVAGYFSVFVFGAN